MTAPGIGRAGGAAVLLPADARPAAPPAPAAFADTGPAAHSLDLLPRVEHWTR
ncbi:hypothetical protein [Lentzea aerocolonigenes]|uniref:hypothetical protein n=1 Tax=Lentzea aerocolonigenes TaxID=68170 RepID=UPI000AAF9605|nr:hypothetical protein [Lentzea aerocolonigenes]